MFLCLLSGGSNLVFFKFSGEIEGFSFCLWVNKVLFVCLGLKCSGIECFCVFQLDRKVDL